MNRKRYFALSVPQFFDCDDNKNWTFTKQAKSQPKDINLDKGVFTMNLTPTIIYVDVSFRIGRQWEHYPDIYFLER